MPVVDVSGVQLFYERHVGHGDRPPVVLVCGTGQPAASWTMFGMIGTFTAAGHDVITFENRGMPPSTCPTPPWTTDDMANDVIGLMSELCDQPAHVLGASLGANIVHVVALRRPDLVRSATMVVGGTQFVAGYQPLMRGVLELFVEHGHVPGWFDTYVNIMSILPPAARADASQIASIEAMADTFVAGFGPGGQHGQIAANVSWMDGGEARITELADMQVPCLMTAHEHDPFFALADMQRAAATIPDCRLEVFSGISHVPADPDSLARLNAVAVEHFAMH